ncbi:MAG TPA: ATP synthase F1 subunit epsilon [Candidatus Absconditabacterales bacterium]|nr:ATP synthase F1 subunit epsilon [Candidatus Absconditabacterales bacterium]
MKLKISSPTKTIFEGEIKQITLPTEIGEVSILPGHAPMVTALKPGIIKIIPEKQVSTSEFIFSKNTISLSVSKGMAFVDGKIVRVVTAIATTGLSESAKDLEDRKSKLEEEIKQLKKQGSIEEIEKSLIQLEKINADIKLKKLKS